MGSSAIVRDLKRDLSKKNREVTRFSKDLTDEYAIKEKYFKELHGIDFGLQELDLKKEDDDVYKLVGPVFVKQEPAEPKPNITRRIMFINAELARNGEMIDDLEQKLKSKMDLVSKIEHRLRSLQVSEDEDTPLFTLK